MAVPNMMDPLEWLREHLAEADPDLCRAMLATFAEQLMAAEAQAACEAEIEDLKAALGEAYVQLRVWKRSADLLPPSRTSR